MTKNQFPETKDLIRRLLPGEENKEIRNLMYIFIHTDLTNAKEFEKVDGTVRAQIQTNWEAEKTKMDLLTLAARKIKSKEEFKKSILSEIQELTEMSDLLEIYYLLEKRLGAKRKNISYIIPHKNSVEVVRYREGAKA